MNVKRLNKLITVLILLMASSTTSAARAGSGGLSGAFVKGDTSVGIVAGSGTAFNDEYIILGVGVGYYVFDGLELGIDVQHWFSGDPSISKISPQIRYVFTQPKTIKPYLGAFFRQTFIDNQDNENSFGYRAGAYFSGRNGVYIGGGIVYEEYQDCSRFIDCSTTYPEVLISISF